MIEARNAYNELRKISEDDNLPETDVKPDAALVEAARAGVDAARDAYEKLMISFYGSEASLSDNVFENAQVPKDLIDGTVISNELTVEEGHLESYLLSDDAMDGDTDLNEKYADIGAKALYDAYIALLKDTIDDSTIDAIKNIDMEDIEKGTGEITLDDRTVLNSCYI